MKLKKIFKGSLLFLLFLIPIKVETAVGASHLNLLKNVVTQQEKGAVVFRLEFQNPVGNYNDPVFFKKSIQLDLGNSFIKPAKRYFPTGDSVISKVYVAQFSPNTVRVRFVLVENGMDVSSNFHLTKQGRFLLARVDKFESDVLEDLLKKIRERDKSKLDKPGVTAHTVKPLESSTSINKKVLPESNLLSVPEDLNKAKKENSLLVNKLSMTGDKKTFKFLNFQESSENGPPDLISSGITMFSMLAIVLAIMFVLFYLFKKFVLKNGLLGGKGNLVKVLGTGMIAPRKTVALVEVAGEILVLGISNDHIALLSTIRDERKIEQIKGDSFSTVKTAASFEFENGGNSQSMRETGKSADNFRKYLKQFGADNKKIKEQSIDGVRAMIRKNLGKTQMV